MPGEGGVNIAFTVPMRPFPKQRPRSAAGKRPYMDSGYKAQKKQCHELARCAYGKPFPLLTGPVELSATFRYRKGPHADIDNLAGGLMDSLNGVCWVDDRQVKRGVLAIETGCAEDQIVVSIAANAARETK